MLGEEKVCSKRAVVLYTCVLYVYEEVVQVFCLSVLDVRCYGKDNNNSNPGVTFVPWRLFPEAGG